MARFARCAQVLLVLDGVMAALFMWGPGLTVPPATSVSPPSACIAQAPVYQAIAKFQVHIVGLLASSALLCALVWVEVAESANDTVTGMSPFFRRIQRGSMVIAVVFTGVAVGLGLFTYGDVLAAKASVFSCLPLTVRVSFITTYTFTGAVCLYVTVRLFWIVARSE